MASAPKRSDDVQILTISDVEPTIQERIDGIDAWLRNTGVDCKNEQRHCEEGTIERVYWHYGYMVALRDALNLLKRESQIPS